MNQKIKNILSFFIPQRVYTGDQLHLRPIEMRMTNGECLVLHQYQILGEEIVFQCRDKRTNAERGFIVKNIKYKFFGDVCNTVQEALTSANDKWFLVMGIRQKKKKK